MQNFVVTGHVVQCQICLREAIAHPANNTSIAHCYYYSDLLYNILREVHTSLIHNVINSNVIMFLQGKKLKIQVF